MYHHFPTKKACGLRVIRERVAPAVRQTWIDPLATAHSTEGIRAIFREITDELETAGRVRGCPLNNLALELSLADPEYRAEIERIFRDWQDALSEKLRSDVSNKKVKNIYPDSFATMIVATYSGAMAIAKAEQDTRALRLCAQQLSAALGNPQSARAIR
jgi:TetR/AcrR family transcriptional repressor of nem operon